MIRIPGPGRIENRTIDGAANPYLAPAVMLAAGLDGVENKMPAGSRNDLNLYEVAEEELKADGIGFLPANLSEALDELEQDEVIKTAMGSKYADYYIQVKRAEWKRYHDSVSQWEVENYLGLY
jgi:glutamine synthetase